MTKLLNLRRAGNNTRFTVKRKGGKTIIDIQLHIEIPRPSPSYLPCKARRKNTSNALSVTEL